MSNLVIVLILFFIILQFIDIKEHFDYLNYSIPILNGYTNFPFDNQRLGQTRNMSYDIRGDPLVIPHQNFVWNNSEIYPIHNPGIDEV